MFFSLLTKAKSIIIPIITSPLVILIKMEKMDAQLHFWLSTTFQNIIEVSLQLSKNPAPEETPYVYKY